jgi:predicted ATP-binding protein involved in virulence
MSIDTNEIEKYIFDPNNPRQCKSYNLLLNIAKKDNLVYISSDYLAFAFKNIIENDEFNSQLWDKPENYNELSINDKIKLFKKSLSEKEYNNLINKLEFNFSNSIYFRLFKSFFDFHPDNLFSNKMNFYTSSLIKYKLLNDHSYDTEKYNTVLNESFHGHKILFTNEIKYGNIDYKLVNQNNDFFDISSIIICEVKKLHSFLSENIKPILLRDMADLGILLNVLENDLKKEKSKEIRDEEISFLKSIEIKDFYSIKDLKLENLSDKKEIYILGENGDGKSLFLQALTVGLKGVEEGDVFNLVKSQKDYELKIEDASGNTYDSKENVYKNLFAYGANRNNNCQMKEDESGYLTIFNPSWDLKNPIEWLKYLDHSEKSGKTNIVSVEMEKKLLNELLDKDVEIDISPETVIFKERGSIVTFEQLSAGYKGVITIIADLLVRLSENQPQETNINEFKGIVLIDEVELHLHPKWKYNFVKRLRDIFPKIQFIMTTHSPTVLLGASKEAVFYKIYKEDGEVKISNQMANEGYTNNSLISSPLFDLGTITSRDYDKTISSDDYIYDKIHQRISEKLKDNINIKEDEILRLIDEELDAL